MARPSDMDQGPKGSRFVWEDGDVQIVHSGPKYPEITVKLVGEDGNAYNVLGLVLRALKRAGLPQAELAAFTAEATAGDYDALLQTVMRWVDVE